MKRVLFALEYDTPKGARIDEVSFYGTTVNSIFRKAVAFGTEVPNGWKLVRVSYVFEESASA